VRPTQAGGEGRVALVIGNAGYEADIGRLKNPANDAADVAAALRALGFDLIGGRAHLDVNLRQMDDLVRSFGREIRRGGVGVFYYSGHGIQVNRFNYLLPLGARVEKEQDVPFEAFNVDRVLAEMEAAENKLNILILDACRNNPLTRSFRSGARGLSRPESVPTGTYVAFAARDGQVASDNAEGRNGLYTQELLRNIGRPGLRLEDIFIDTRREVRRLSKNAQVPVEYGSIDAPFFFTEEGAAAPPATTSPLPAYRRWLDSLSGADNRALLRELDAELARNPANALALRVRSSAFYLDGDAERGRRDVEAAVRLLASPRTAEEYEARCYANWRLAKADEAVGDCGRAVELDPRFKWAYMYRGNSYRLKQENDRALADYDKVVELDPRNAFTYNNRGLLYFEKKEYDRAIADYNKAVESDPRYRQALYNRGIAYAEKKEHDRAIADFTRVVGLDPNDILAYNRRGNAYREKKNYDRALADYDKAIEIDPKLGYLYYNRGLAYADKREHDRAIADFTKAIELNEKDAPVYYNRGVAYSERKDYDRAIADYSKAIELDPQHKWAYSDRGVAYSEKKDYDRAIADYDRAIGLDPNYVLAYNRRGNAYREKKNYDRALADYNKAVGLDPSFALTYNNRGAVYADRQDYDRAIADYTRAIDLNPQFALPYRNRALAYDAKGDTARAAADRQKAADLEKPQP